MTTSQDNRGPGFWLWLIALGLCLSVFFYWCANLKFTPDKVRINPTPTPSTGATFAGPTITKGTWRVGQDVQPGTYQAVVPNIGNMYCAWSRLNTFQAVEDWTPEEGKPSIIIKADTALIGETVTVKILPTDVAFETNGCGTWTKID